MRIASWNINGIRSVHDNLVKFLKDYDIDILALQEIKIHGGDITDKIRYIKNYYSFFNPADKKGYSGTAFYTKIKPSKIEQGLGQREFDSQGRVISANIGGYEIVNLYFPHSSRDLSKLDFKMDFNKTAIKFIESKLSQKLIICGDFNVAHNEIDIARPKQNMKNAGFTQIERDFFSKLLNVGLVDVYRKKHPKKQEFTWWSNMFSCRTKNIGWRIDYFLTRPNLYNKIKTAEISTEVFGSDHCPILIELHP